MRAIVQQGYGGPQVLKVEDVARPTAGQGEVVIGVKAAAIDRGTWHLMTGTPLIARLFLGLKAPRQRIQGRDASGVIVEVGPGAEAFAVGDEVFGTADGSLAEFAVIPVKRLVKKPSSLTFEQAAALPISGLTALQAVQDLAKIQTGERVLVLGASGGVGSYAVQLARALGARVTAVCSEAKAPFVRSLGADEVVPYGNRPLHFATPFDAIIDIGGNPSVKWLRSMLREGGRGVIVGGEGKDALTNGLWRGFWALLSNLVRAKKLFFFLSEEKAEDMQRLARHVTEGSLWPAIDRVLPFDQAQEAMTLLDQGQVRGKLVLTP